MSYIISHHAMSCYEDFVGVRTQNTEFCFKGCQGRKCHYLCVLYMYIWGFYVLLLSLTLRTVCHLPPFSIYLSMDRLESYESLESIFLISFLTVDISKAAFLSYCQKTLLAVIKCQFLNYIPQIAAALYLACHVLLKLLALTVTIIRLECLQIFYKSPGMSGNTKISVFWKIT